MTRRRGTVEAFDVEAGHGTVRDEDGHDWFFHCTAIADGSRRIDTGTAVDFEIVAGQPGVWEAGDLRPVG